MSALAITVVALIIGVILATPFLIWTSGQPDAGRRFYAVGLGVTALIYVVFALIGGASGCWLGLEVVGVLLNSGVAWIGFRKAAAMLALGWAMHPVWDVALHLNGTGAGYTPGWYPWGCVSFDLMVAGAALTAARGSSLIRLNTTDAPASRAGAPGSGRRSRTPSRNKAAAYTSVDIWDDRSPFDRPCPCPSPTTPTLGDRT